MTYSAAAYFDDDLVDDRRASSVAAGRALRILLNGSAIGLGAVAVIGTAAIAVTLAAGWMAGGVVQPHARLMNGPASLALVPYDPASRTVAGAPSPSWANAFVDRTKPIIASTERARPAIAEPKPAHGVARSRAIPLPRPMPARLAQTRAQLEPPTMQTVATLEPRKTPEASPALPSVTIPTPLARPDIKQEIKPEVASKPESKIEAMTRIEPKPTTMPKPSGVASIPAVLPDSISRTAVYDIAGSVVFMPDGSKLEAHSGMGEKMDDPRFKTIRMRGPTPPNVYVLTERESLFHGVRAIRLNPVDRARMFGRDGMLAHTYMIGPTGQSNGCVSFKDYNKFLTAFLDGKVDKLVVVDDLKNMSWKAAALQAEGVTASTRRFAGGYSRPRFFARRDDEGPRYTSALGFASERGAGTW
ncbi:MAG: tlde1 domain-containing protein [Pseudolabrys sp.]|jgi:hypothetical protein